MAAIDGLLAQIEDKILLVRISSEVKKLTEEKTFGLVFEDHLPELTPLYSENIRKGSTVAIRSDDIANVWRVISVVGKAAKCINRRDGKERLIPVSDLVVVLQFGEPIFPSVVPMDRVKNGPDDAPWHTLIEADNYHALQLLEYLYAGQVDCIYIDPPYNSGGQRDWKYNNNYVDEKDGWRHSKWLAMLSRRLKIAKRLLKHDGVLIIAIDENEHAHLLGLLEKEFAEFKLTSVAVVHNPRGNRENNFTMINDFAVHVIRKNVTVLAKSPTENTTPRKLRRWGHFSKRTERRPSFYPIYVKDSEIIRIGTMPDDGFHPTGRNILQEDGSIEIWPIDDDDEERRWNYGLDSIETHLDRIVALPRSDGDLDLFITAELSQPKSVWIGPEYDAGGKYGTSLVEHITRRNFPYPKSLYTVIRSLDNVIRNKPDALVLDFFAGSGTTIHAINLLNIKDNGRRRCLMVTNNEVSASEAAEFKRKGIMPGDEEWEANGVCRSITWPRSKFSIIGKRSDNSVLEGELATGRMIEIDKPRPVRRISFTSSEKLTSLTSKKELVALLGKAKLPQSAVERDAPFVIAEGYPTSILFDEDCSSEWLDAMVERDDIVEFFVVASTKKRFDEIKKSIQERFGRIESQEEESRRLSLGFPANIEFFRLDFLDKNHVQLGSQFRELLPILWLRAGALGPRPDLPKSMGIPAMLIPEKNPFAVLVDESKYREFLTSIEGRTDLTHVFLVTDSEDAFHEMASEIAAPNVVQLYRDYLENFMINRGEAG